MTQIPDAAVQAAAKAIMRSGDTYTEMAKAALTSAIPYLQPVDVAAVRRQAFEEALDAVGRVKDNFMSDEYATPQPMGSLPERFACDAVSEAILALKGQQHDD